ncbi:MAG TPA: bifunctional diaminohydroxyphosphoribosylaminopyrimidine deaminase/5-amino-6-(5-phosphoribosylamino)uracil reductase RibD [Crocinitomix sp.]|nr:bifunctional diaminohydroxyphosphoribosylaminopyrimidine deaminase/5-amino-6-(5-phosphoribosylamino)uracil reductase RibD [Crocinitomix sp.]
MAKIDEKYMRRAISLAKLGKGDVSPNPMVGCVIVHNDTIIGEGYHQKYGEAHAEVNAINSVKNKKLLKKSTIYVNLEPCAHFGKTPPCSNLIIDSKISRVVIGCVDSYAEVAGKGIKRMQQAGIEVSVGVLETESLWLNRRFFTFHQKQRPYIVLKWAQSTNGFIDINRLKHKEKGVFWITQPETKVLVHKWRAIEAGILVGRKTVENDNPSLTCREYYGQQPTRIVIDKELTVDYSQKKIVNNVSNTIIVNQKKSEIIENIEYLKVDNFSLPSILHQLYLKDIQSVIVEGGKTTLQFFIDNNLWDEARVLTGINQILNGVKAPELHAKIIDTYRFGKDNVKIFKAPQQ